MNQTAELVLTDEGLALSDGKNTVRGDFTRLLPRLRRGNLSRELLVRAVTVKGIDRPLVADATAGLGEDSFLLAAAGCRVLLFEYDPVIADLLSDALERAKRDPETAEIAARMTLLRGDPRAPEPRSRARRGTARSDVPRTEEVGAGQKEVPTAPSARTPLRKRSGAP